MRNQINISSTQVRKLLSEGNVKGAAEMLGRDYEIFGEVVHGDKRGRELGYPTANLECDSENKLLRQMVFMQLWWNLTIKCIKVCLMLAEGPHLILKILLLKYIFWDLAEKIFMEKISV
jgi:FAD synthase